MYSVQVWLIYLFVVGILICISAFLVTVMYVCMYVCMCIHIYIYI